MDVFIRDVCQCDHSNQNLMVSNNIKNYYSRPYKIEAMRISLVVCGYGQFSGLCIFGAFVNFAG